MTDFQKKLISDANKEIDRLYGEIESGVHSESYNWPEIKYQYSIIDDAEKE